ncbi:MAG: hypothetical protein J0L62_12955 [Bacteroidetes bacterium]|nr:hypothetical protein [Bacteroidota bacterium]
MKISNLTFLFILFLSQFGFVSISVSFAQEVKSTKTRFLIELPPDYLDSALAKQEFEKRDIQSEITLKGFLSFTGGVRVGQSFFSNQPSQIIGKRFELEQSDSTASARFLFDEYSLDSENKSLSKITLLSLGFGYHLRSPSGRSFYGSRLNGGIITGNQNVTFSGNLATGLDFYFRTYPRTSYLSSFFLEVGAMTSKKQLFLEGTAGYSIYLGNYVNCSFVFRQIRTAEKVTSGSLGVMLGFFVPDFEIRKRAN